MEIYAISFLIFVAFGAALAIGLLLGRGPIHGSCRPDCAGKGSCTIPCEKRRKQSKIGETSQC